jgi:cryptochrome
MGFDSTKVTTSFKGKGGEMAALARLSHHLSKTQWIKSFEKPETSPNSLEPSTTALSPYVSFGCLGARQFYWGVKDVYASGGTSHSQPPVSLEGQLLWREFFYAQAATVANFDKMKGNPVCRQIDWQYDAAKIEAWEQGRTGYPFIDAIMNQLRSEGWIHHLARHAVACFLTRGDLYQSWEVGAKIFDKHLLDSDWALNCGNWMWLSASAYFHQFFRVYSPVAFGKKTDKEGDYIRKWVPGLKKLSSKYIYSPWEASPSLLKECNIVLGETYPHRICVHEEISKTNMSLHGLAYARKRENDASGATDGVIGSADESDGVGQLQLASNPAAARAYATRFKLNIGELPRVGGGGGGDAASAAAAAAAAGQAPQAGGGGGNAQAGKKRQQPAASEQTIEDMFKKSKKGGS